MWPSSPHGFPYLPALWWAPFPTKSVRLSACVSPQTIHFWALVQSPLSGPGSSPPPPSCNTPRKRGVGLGSREGGKASRGSDTVQITVTGPPCRTPCSPQETEGPRICGNSLIPIPQIRHFFQTRSFSGNLTWGYVGRHWCVFMDQKC